MGEMFNVTIDGITKQYSSDTTYRDIVLEYQRPEDEPIILVKVNNKLRELYKTVWEDCTLEFVRFSDRAGFDSYRRSLIMLFYQACYHVLGVKYMKDILVLNTVGDGFFIEMYLEEDGVSEEIVAKIDEKMRECVEADTPFVRYRMSIEKAKDYYEKFGMPQKIDLSFYSRKSHIKLYELNGYYDYFYGSMAASAGCLSQFKLFKFEKGVMLILPIRHNFNEIRNFKIPRKFINACTAQRILAKNNGISTVADLNDIICSKHVEELILVSEAWQEKSIAEIANEIASREGIRFVMIAGPSSSGKTTFSNRLSIQLRTQGKTPIPIALDDYYKNRVDCPIDENGEYDYECLEALDLETFNQNMLDLMAGKRVELPEFNFVTGKREYNGRFLQLEPSDILVIEGIHGLNEKLSYLLPKENKFKIYISALTQINIDEHNRIATTDGRLIRRIVRDARTRNCTASDTIMRWESVRKGEEKYIFPYQESADLMFNSSLLFELSVLKTYAEPLLFAVREGDPGFYEAKRLLKFLDYFVCIPGDNINKNSILREFIGGSCFRV